MYSHMDTVINFIHQMITFECEGGHNLVKIGVDGFVIYVKVKLPSKYQNPLFFQPRL